MTDASNQYNKPNTNDRRGRNPMALGVNTGTYSGLGKLPPQAIDLEEAVLGALMLEKDALSSVIDILKPEVFYKDNHQKIFQAIKTLFEKTSSGHASVTYSHALQTMLFYNRAS